MANYPKYLCKQGHDLRIHGTCKTPGGRRQCQICAPTLASEQTARKKPIAPRFWAKVNKSADCWEWQGSKSNGYGKFNPAGKTVYAHRWSYEFCYGSIPDGLFVCHKCDNPLCVNPGHFFLGAHEDNMADMSRKGRAANKNPTHCLRGHEYTPENTSYKDRQDIGGGKVCKTCRRQRAADLRGRGEGVIAQFANVITE